MLNEYNPLESEGRRIKKILVLVRCPECSREFFINQEELKSPLSGGNWAHKTECRACKKIVKLIKL